MKFRVRVGREFEGEIIIDVVGKPQRELSIKKVAAVVLVTAILAGTFCSVVYGMATGDFSVVKAIAGAGRELIELAVKMTAKVKQ